MKIFRIFKVFPCHLAQRSRIDIKRRLCYNMCGFFGEKTETIGNAEKEKSIGGNGYEHLEKAEGTVLTLSLEGRLDTTTSPVLEAELKHSVEGITELVIDMAALEYISSSGLRVLLSAQKVMNRQGKMSIRNVNETIMEIFEVTGFADILTIEQN